MEEVFQSFEERTRGFAEVDIITNKTKRIMI